MVVEQGRVVFHPASAHPRKLQTIDHWTSAFHTFMAVFTVRHPNRFGELLKYSESIRLAAAQFPGLGWRSYDEQFRLRQEVHPSRSWAVLDSELWLTVAAAASTSFLPVAANNHMAMGRNVSSNSKGGLLACHAFNAGSCRWNPCKYPHRCSSCSRFGHGAATCRMGNSKGKHVELSANCFNRGTHNNAAQSAAAAAGKPVGGAPMVRTGVVSSPSASLPGARPVSNKAVYTANFRSSNPN